MLFGLAFWLYKDPNEEVTKDVTMETYDGVIVENKAFEGDQDDETNNNTEK